MYLFSDILTKRGVLLPGAPGLVTFFLSIREFYIRKNLNIDCCYGRKTAENQSVTS